MKLLTILFLALFLALALQSDEKNRGQEASQEGKSQEFCSKVNAEFKKNKWNRIICNPARWKVYGYTSKGNPLFYQDFGFENESKDIPVNILICSVHGDEANGTYACFYLIRDILYDNPDVLKNMKLVVVPIANPDGFLTRKRTNGRGVDINRNMPTKDWAASAMKVWEKTKKDPNKFPGDKANSEIETEFQVFIIEKYKPDKIFSMHAPYGWLDFDGPGDKKYYNLLRVENRAKFVALNMQANSKNYLKMVNFGFFPGSLGNYAGQERKIPTYTVELPATDVSKADFYWSIMRMPLIKALSFKVYDNKETNSFYEEENTTFMKNIKNHLQKHPKAQAEDIYKYIYQSVFGPAHLLHDKDMAKSELLKEWSSLTQSSIPEEEIEILDSESSFARLNLRPFKKNGGDVESLYKAIIETAGEMHGQDEKLEQRFNLILASKDIMDKKMVEDLTRVYNEMKLKKFPEIHHSDVYKKEYKPAYRVVNPNFIEKMHVESK